MYLWSHICDSTSIDVNDAPTMEPVDYSENERVMHGGGMVTGDKRHSGATKVSASATYTGDL